MAPLVVVTLPVTRPWGPTEMAPFVVRSSPASALSANTIAPLVLITADRPARFRGTGAPQSIEQIGLFGVYAETDLEVWKRRGPLHVNVEFDEPLI